MIPAWRRQKSTARAGNAGIALLAGEALLGRGGDDLAVAEQAGGAVVVEGRDAEDVHRLGGRGGAHERTPHQATNSVVPIASGT